MFEPKELLGPIATLFAVLFAIASFLFIRAIVIYKEKQKALSEIDIPENIKRRVGFIFGTHGDILIIFSTGILTLILGVYYCPELLYKIASFYLGSSSISPEKILNDFKELVDTLRWFSFAVIIVPFVLFASDIFISKRLPVIVKFYAGNVLGQRLIKKEEADSLLPEARRLYESKAFGESVFGMNP